MDDVLAVSASAAQGAAPAASAAFVLDDFSSPAPAVTLSVAGASSLPITPAGGAYARSVSYQSFNAPDAHGAEFRVGNGKFLYVPGAGSAGETDIRYLRDSGPDAGGVPLDLSPYTHVRLDFGLAGDSLNLNALFTNLAPPEGTNYYASAGVNYTWTLGVHSAFIRIDQLFKFDRSRVDGFTLVVDRSGSGASRFALDRIVFTSHGPGHPRPARPGRRPER